MTRRHPRTLSSATTMLVAAACFMACDNNNDTTNVIPTNNAFKQTNLVTDASGAPTVDANLVNAWGLAFGPTGLLWASNNHSGTSTVYDAAGTKQSTVVTIPAAEAGGTGAPTGVISNSTSDFTINGGSPAIFIFAGEDGIISAWNASSGGTAALVADRSSHDAVYKGIAMASNGGANFLYLTDFKNAHVDVFDKSFTFVKSFTDPSIPSGFAPFGIGRIGGELYVTFAKQKGPDNEDDDPGVGNGYVVVFNPDGSVSKRFASTGKLNSPWAVAVAPSGFGPFGGDILVGNFGDGLIGAYDPVTGTLVDMLKDSTGNPIAIDGLWGLTFGSGANGTTLYFAAGPQDENHGLLGTLTVP